MATAYEPRRKPPGTTVSRLMVQAASGIFVSQWNQSRCLRMQTQEWMQLLELRKQEEAGWGLKSKPVSVGPLESWLHAPLLGFVLRV
jgi:hypothetical protein